MMSTEVEIRNLDAASEAGIKTVLSVVKNLDDLEPLVPPSTPTGQDAAEDGGSQETEKGEEAPTTYNAFPRFRVTWDVSAPAKSGHSPNKSQEMTPEATLVEFISTSASFFNVKRQNMKKLEWDILNVFYNNVMPANAAAWYMAKRRYYLDKPWLLQLLPYLLTHYPKKFSVNAQNNTVEFQELYSKEVAKKKMQYLVHQGLFAYFSHKADEYGVYFFDPLYYETTEPFHANLRLVTNNPVASSKSKLVNSFFKLFKEQFHFKHHSHCLVSISKTDTEILTNTVGIISSMIDNSYGIVQFKHGNESAKAIFCARTLFKDGYVYDKDPMNLPAISFDGYKVPGDPRSEGKDYTWYAVLVWVGRKPSPKYNATKELLTSSQYFQNQPVTYNQLAGLVEEPHGPPTAMPHLENQKLDDCMRVGEVITIQRNGAVVSMHKNSGEKAFIPGWSFKLARQPGTYLTTTQAVTLAMGDIIAFYIDPKLKADPYYGVGFNVMVLKHSKQPAQAAKSDEEGTAKPAEGQKRKSKKSKKSEGEGSGSSGSNEKAAAAKNKAKSSGRRRRSTRLSSMASESSVEAGGRRRKRTLSEKAKSRYLDFLLKSELLAEAAYNSDEDPTFVPPPIFEPDYDFDEYSDGEIEESEGAALAEDLKKEPEGVVDDNPEPKAEGDADVKTVKKPSSYIGFLLSQEIVEDEEAEEADRDYNLPPGVAASVAGLAPPEKASEQKKDGAEEDGSEEPAQEDTEEAVDEDDVISAEEVAELLKEAEAELPPELLAPKPADIDALAENIAKLSVEQAEASVQA